MVGLTLSLAVLVVALALFAVGLIVFRNAKVEDKGHPRGRLLGYSTVLGLPAGMPFGLALGNISWGPSFGLALGLLIGLMLETKYNKNPRRLTEEEVKMRKYGVSLGVMTFLSGVSVYTTLPINIL